MSVAIWQCWTPQRVIVKWQRAATIGTASRVWHSDAMPTSARGLPGPITIEAASLLRQRIAELNRNQADVATDAGIPTSTLSRLLNAKKPIYLDQLDGLCNALGLEIGALLDSADQRSARRHLNAVEPSTAPADAPTPAADTLPMTGPTGEWRDQSTATRTGRTMRTHRTHGTTGGE